MKTTLRSYVPVTILAFDGSMEMSIAMARDAWYAGAVARQNTDPSLAIDPAEQVVVATQDGSPVTTFSGTLYQPDCAMSEIERTDLVVVSGIWGKVEELTSNNRPAAECLATPAGSRYQRPTHRRLHTR